VLLLDPPLGELRARIASRVADMLAAGFLDEVRALRAAGYGGAKPLQALGYAQLGAVLDGKTSQADAAADTVRATNAYARRQRTWFRSQPATRRYDAAPGVDAAVDAFAERAAVAS
jgi:tRNA dimethylallyltransferase